MEHGLMAGRGQLTVFLGDEALELSQLLRLGAQGAESEPEPVLEALRHRLQLPAPAPAAHQRVHSPQLAPHSAAGKGKGILGSLPIGILASPGGLAVEKPDLVHIVRREAGNSVPKPPAG